MCHRSFTRFDVNHIGVVDVDIKCANGLVGSKEAYFSLAICGKKDDVHEFDGATHVLLHDRHDGIIVRIAEFNDGIVGHELECIEFGHQIVAVDEPIQLNVIRVGRWINCE